MPVQQPPNSISLGEDEWIDYIDLKDRYALAREIDVELASLEPMWQALETQCVAGCCGIDAFDFWPNSIQAAAQLVDPGRVCEHLSLLKQTLGSLNPEVILSTRLNLYADTRVFVSLLDHLLKHFAACRDANS